MKIYLVEWKDGNGHVSRRAFQTREGAEREFDRMMEARLDWSLDPIQYWIGVNEIEAEP